MERVPLPVWAEIAKFLPINDLFRSFVLVNKKCWDVLENEGFLLSIFLNSLKISKSLKIGKECMKNILKNLQSMHHLEFTGFGTTGGCQDEDENYWVGNLYSLDYKIPGYPSARNKLNINTAGVLSSTQDRSLEENSKLVNDLHEELYHVRIQEESFDHNEILSKIYQEIHETQLIEDDAQVELTANKVLELFSKLNYVPFNLETLRRRPDDRHVLTFPIDYEHADSMENFFIMKFVYFNRPMHYTCPVETFMIFVSDTYVDIESEEFEQFDNLLTPESLEPLGNKYCISNTREKNGVTYRTFENKCRCIEETYNLKPVLWGKFSRDADSISLELDEIFAGVYLYTKLINPCNRNPELGYTHGEFNIDAFRIEIQGLEIDNCRF